MLCILKMLKIEQLPSTPSLPPPPPSSLTALLKQKGNRLGLSQYTFPPPSFLRKGLTGNDCIQANVCLQEFSIKADLHPVISLVGITLNKYNKRKGETEQKKQSKRKHSASVSACFLAVHASYQRNKLTSGRCSPALLLIDMDKSTQGPSSIWFRKKALLIQFLHSYRVIIQKPTSVFTSQEYDCKIQKNSLDPGLQEEKNNSYTSESVKGQSKGV